MRQREYLFIIIYWTITEDNSNTCLFGSVCEPFITANLVAANISYSSFSHGHQSSNLDWRRNISRLLNSAHFPWIKTNFMLCYPCRLGRISWFLKVSIAFCFSPLFYSQKFNITKEKTFNIIFLNIATIFTSMTLYEMRTNYISKKISCFLIGFIISQI